MIQALRSMDSKSSRESRAKRLKSLRKMTRLSRKAFAERHRISSGTLQNWESARFGGLSEKGAKSVLHAIRAEGIEVSFAWLMYGVEPGPSLTERLYLGDAVVGIAEPMQRASDPNTLEVQISAITQELLVFRKCNSNPVDYIVTDDGMYPRFVENEHVAGSRRYQQDIAQLIGQDCIVQTVDNEMLVRRLRWGSKPGLYNVVCTNPDTKVTVPVLYDVELLYAALVVWARRCESN